MLEKWIWKESKKSNRSAKEGSESRKRETCLCKWIKLVVDFNSSEVELGERKSKEPIAEGENQETKRYFFEIRYKKLYTFKELNILTADSTFLMIIIYSINYYILKNINRKRINQRNKKRK